MSDGSMSQIFGDNWEEVINEKRSSKGGRRWHGIATIKQP